VADFKKFITLPDNPEWIEMAKQQVEELVHTRRKDHSKAFWAEMDKLVGNGKKMASKLKKYGLGLY